jgi:hypothetical protein
LFYIESIVQLYNLHTKQDYPFQLQLTLHKLPFVSLNKGEAANWSIWHFNAIAPALVQRPVFCLRICSGIIPKVSYYLLWLYQKTNHEINCIFDWCTRYIKRRLGSCKSFSYNREDLHNYGTYWNS